jgi:hypothetical protein
MGEVGGIEKWLEEERAPGWVGKEGASGGEMSKDGVEREEEQRDLGGERRLRSRGKLKGQRRAEA